MEIMIKKITTIIMKTTTTVMMEIIIRKMTMIWATAITMMSKVMTKDDVSKNRDNNSTNDGGDMKSSTVD